MKTNGWIKLTKDLMDSPAWITAPLGVRCLVLAIWRRHTGANNGKIPYARREAQADLGCGSHQAVRWLREAQERGFIAPTKRGSFEWKSGARAARATTWMITMEPWNGSPATNDWQRWTPPEIHSTGAGATPQRVPERHHCRKAGAGATPVKPKSGCRSDTTSKTKSSYQGGSPPARPPASAWAGWSGLSAGERAALARQERAATAAHLHAVLNDPKRLALFAAYRTLAIWSALVLAHGPGGGQRLDGAPKQNRRRSCTFSKPRIGESS
jgi:hypothetical protein